MDTLNVPLPDPLKPFVRERVAQGGFADAAEYVRTLIRADQAPVEQDRVDALLQEGLDSGGPIPATESYWQAKRRRVTDPPAAT